MSGRLEKLRRWMATKGLDSFLVSSPENRRYFSGFSGSAGYLLVSAEHAVLATDFRYIEQSQHEAPSFRVVRIGTDNSWFASTLRKISVRRVGFEAQNLSVAVHKDLSNALKSVPRDERPSLVSTTEVDTIRAVKESDELALLQRAIDVGDEAFRMVAAPIEPGVTEREVAWRLEKTIRELGGEAVAFDLIVAAGPNGALPHHKPSDRPLGTGEPIVIDMGARVSGYHSDLTRTIWLGQPDETFRKVYDIVLGAQLTAIATVQAGMTGADADGLARKVIQEAGYGDAFGHGLGHGVGLAIHEYPRLGTSSSHQLEDGMCFTIEPGIYLSGWGGVRIEDVIILEKGGARVLSKAPKAKSFGGKGWY